MLLLISLCRWGSRVLREVNNLSKVIELVYRNWVLNPNACLVFQFSIYFLCLSPSYLLFSSLLPTPPSTHTYPTYFLFLLPFQLVRYTDRALLSPEWVGSQTSKSPSLRSNCTDKGSITPFWEILLKCLIHGRRKSLHLYRAGLRTHSSFFLLLFSPFSYSLFLLVVTLFSYGHSYIISRYF